MLCRVCMFIIQTRRSTLLGGAPSNEGETHMKRSTRAAIVLATSLTIVAAGCGDDDTSSDDTKAPAETTAGVRREALHACFERQLQSCSPGALIRWQTDSDTGVRIAALRQEQDALKRQLIKARWETHALRDVNRKNSAPRVLVEERVLATLRREGKAMHNGKLFMEARLVNFELIPSTFRTYLHRMKEKGLIMSRRRGYWEVATSSGGNTPSPGRDS